MYNLFIFYFFLRGGGGGGGGVGVVSGQITVSLNCPQNLKSGCDAQLMQGRKPKSLIMICSYH